MTANATATASQTSVTASGENAPLDDHRVAQYLADHPDFFHQHPNILSEMALPHNNGNAISLIERQVAILRDRSMQTRHKLGELIEAAKENDALFNKTQTLVLLLLNQPNLNAIFSELEEQLQQHFAVESARLLLICDQTIDGLPPQYQRGRTEAETEIAGILRNRHSLCGKIRPSEAAFIFPDHSATINNTTDTTIGSAAITCRHTEEPFAPQAWTLLLAVAHHDPAHYNSDTGTLFIDYLGDILLSLCQRQWAQ